MVYYKEKLRTIYKGGGFMFNFDFYNPTHIVFGKDRLAELDTLVPKEAKVLITYGGGSAVSKWSHRPCYDCAW